MTRLALRLHHGCGVLDIELFEQLARNVSHGYTMPLRSHIHPNFKLSTHHGRDSSCQQDKLIRTSRLHAEPH
jgi:hypothetical protein